VFDIRAAYFIIMNRNKYLEKVISRVTAEFASIKQDLETHSRDVRNQIRELRDESRALAADVTELEKKQAYIRPFVSDYYTIMASYPLKRKLDDVDWDDVEESKPKRVKVSVDGLNSV
jgi:hypothetical protein